MSNKTLIKSIVVLVVICLVISAALAIVNRITAPIIEEASQLRETESRQQLLPAASEFEKLPTDGMPASISSAYKGVDGSGNAVGYVFTAGNQGFDGTIVVMATIDTEGKIVQVSAMDVTSETATLGGQVAKEPYTSQYTGKDASLEGVDIISGATFTSVGFEQCIRDSFAAYDAVKEG